MTTELIEPVDDFEGEIGRSVEIIRRISLAVLSAVKDGAFPLVLAGNCNASVGVAAGLSEEDLVVVWFDAHSDLDTPDECVSGYFDAMGASMLTGGSWKALMATVPGHRPLGLEKFTYCGIRDLSDGQYAKLAHSAAQVVYGNDGTPSDLRVDFATRMGEVLRDSADTPCLVHLDVDCLDTSIGRANEYAAPGGLSKDDILQCLDVIVEKRKPVALTVSSFNPDLEGGDAIAEVAVEAIIHLLDTVILGSESWNDEPE